MKYGKFPTKVAGKIAKNKLCVDPIGPYKIHRRGKILNDEIR